MSDHQIHLGAEALRRAVETRTGRRPKASSPMWRKPVAQAMGLQRIHGSRFEAVVKYAVVMGLLAVDGAYFSAIDRGEPVTLSDAGDEADGLYVMLMAGFDSRGIGSTPRGRERRVIFERIAREESVRQQTARNGHNNGSEK